jgi:hypothetical protein
VRRAISPRVGLAFSIPRDSEGCFPCASCAHTLHMCRKNLSTTELRFSEVSILPY